MYHTRGLTVVRLNADNEFACIKDDILPTNLNMVTAKDYVGDVERSSRTVKESTRCHVHRLPYERYTKLMVMGCVTKSIKDLNQLPSPLILCSAHMEADAHGSVYFPLQS